MTSGPPLLDPQIRNMAQGNTSSLPEGRWERQQQSLQAFRDELVAMMVEAGMDEGEARAFMEESARGPSDDEVVAMAVPPEAEAALRRGDRAEALRIVQASMDIDPSNAGEVLEAMADTPVAIKREALERPRSAETPAPRPAPASRAWMWLLLAAFAALVFVVGLLAYAGAR